MRLRNLSLAGGYMLLAYGLVGLIGIAALRLLTAMAQPAVFGEANLILTTLGLATTVSSQPFTNTQLRFHSAAQASGRGDAFTREVLMWNTLGALAAYGLTLLAWTALTAVGGVRLGMRGALALGLLVLATSVRNVMYGRFQAERRNYLYGGLLVGETAIVTLCTALGLYVSASVDGYIVGQSVGLAGAAFLGIATAPRAALRMATTAGRAPEFLQQARRYGLPFAPVGALGWLANLVERYVLGALAGPAAVGRYVAPFSIASRGMGLFGSALNDVFRPILFAVANTGDEDQGRRIFWLWLGIRGAAALGGVAALALFGSEIASLLLAPAYRDGAAPIMVWIAAAYGIQGMIQTLETRLMSRDRTAWLVPPLAVGGVANLLFSLLLIPRGGVLGAAQATTLSFVVQGAVTVWLLSRSSRVSLGAGLHSAASRTARTGSP